MASTAKIKGVREVVAALHRKRRGHVAGLERGLHRCGLLLLRLSMEIVPVETGVLRASGAVSKTGTTTNPVITIGYFTIYAVYVHENLEAHHGSDYNAKHAAAIKAGRDFARGPDQQAKYLEDPLRANLAQFRLIVRRETAR